MRRLSDWSSAAILSLVVLMDLPLTYVGVMVADSAASRTEFIIAATCAALLPLLVTAFVIGILWDRSKTTSNFRGGMRLVALLLSFLQMCILAGSVREGLSRMMMRLLSLVLLAAFVMVPFYTGRVVANRVRVAVRPD